MSGPNAQPFLLFALIAAVVIAFIAIGAWQTAKRRKELMAWAQSKGLSFSAGKDHGFDERFAEFQCLKQGEDRYAYNVMDGQWASRPFTAFDFHYETHSRDSKGRRQTSHHHFSAAILGSPLPLKPLLIRPERLFDKITEFFGYDDIDFESAEFSRKFYVKAEDKRWAYDVIHPRAMEFLLGAPQFTIQFARDRVMAYRASCFSTADFENAAQTVLGLLERLPQYLVKQLREETE